MTGREKILAALSPEGAPEFGVVIPYEGIYYRDRWRELSRHPWWWPQSPDTDKQLAWYRDAIAAMGMDWFGVHASYGESERLALAIEERPDGLWLVNREDGSSRHLHEPRVAGIPGDGITLSVKPGPDAFTAEGVELAIPDPPGGDPAEYASGHGALARRLIAGFEQHLLPCSSLSSPLWSCYDIWGFEGLMTQLAENPSLVHKACGRLMNLAVSSVRRMAAIGAEAVWIEECMLDMISPAAYREFCLPYLQPLTREIHAQGMAAIHYFCGNPWSRMPELLSTGADALGLEEGKKGFQTDIRQVAECVNGRMAILGNLDSIGVLQDGSGEDLRAALRLQAEAGRANGGRFIFSLGSPVTPSTPLERVRLYTDLARETGAA